MVRIDSITDDLRYIGALLAYKTSAIEQIRRGIKGAIEASSCSPPYRQVSALAN
jgi:hypothetical protein